MTKYTSLPPEEIALVELSFGIMALFEHHRSGVQGLEEILRRLIRAREELLKAHPELPYKEIHLPGFYSTVKDL